MLTERKRISTTLDPISNAAEKDEEWSLRDVVFVEDARSSPTGRVLKVDGAYAAVKFGGKDTSDEANLLQDCRLMRKDDLQVVKPNQQSRQPDCVQRTPRRVPLPDNTWEILTLAVDAQGIHTIIRQGTRLSYVVYNLNSGRVEQDSPFPTNTNAFMGLYPNEIALTSASSESESVLILRDGNCTIYPLSKDCIEAVREPQWLDLPPVRCLGAGTLALSTGTQLKNRAALVVLALDTQILISKVLRCDIDGVRQVLAQTEMDALDLILTERCDGNRNVFHACVTMCGPNSNKIEDNSGDSVPGGGAVPTSNLVTDEPIPTLSWPPDNFDPTSGDEDSLMGGLSKGAGTSGVSGQGDRSTSSSAAHMSSSQIPVIVSDPIERRQNAMVALKLMCDAPVLQPYLREMLSAK